MIRLERNHRMLFFPVIPGQCNFGQKRRPLEDNIGHIGHHIWLDQNRIVTLFRQFALNT
jgi:hypothetical protein